MKKENFSNPLREQVMSLPQLLETQLEHCFSLEKLKNCMSIAEMFDFRKILLTGCGDSFAAAGAMAPVLEQYSDTFGCTAALPMEFTRYTTSEDVGIGEPNSPLFIAISAGGSSARMAEALEKANKMGAFTLLITNNPDSICTKQAKRVFVTETPKMENDFPGLRSYFSNMLALIALACRLGHVRGKLGPGASTQFTQAIRTYVQAFEPILNKIDDQMFALAQKWHTFRRFDCIGDGQQLYSALFGIEKLYECTGITGCYDDSENWCHVNYFVRQPETVGTILFADEDSPAFSRAQETAKAACGIGRPLLVVTNACPSAFPSQAEVCQLPKPPAGFEWLAPLMEHIPASLLAGYCCTVSGGKFFNEYDPLTNAYNGGGRYFNRDIMTMSNSKIELYF